MKGTASRDKCWCRSAEYHADITRW